MASNLRCLNINTPEFEQLVSSTKIDRGALIADVSKWQSTNNTDQIPTLEELYQDEDKRFINVDYAQVLDRDLTSLQGVRKALLNTIEMQIKPLKNIKVEKKNESLIKFKAELIEIQELLSDYDNTETATAVLGYLKKSSILMSNLENQISKLKTYNSRKKSASALKLELEIIGYYKSAITNFGLLPDIKDNINSGLGEDKELKNYEHKDEIIETVDSLTSRLDKAKREILSAQKPRIASLLAPYLNLSKTKARERVEKEFRNNNERKDYKSSDEFEQALLAYIEDKLPTQEQYKEEDYQFLLKKLDRGGVDISMFSAYANSAFDINNVIVQLQNKLLDEADLKMQANIMTKRAKQLSILKDTKLSGSNPKEMYKGMYKEGSDGNLYLTSEYSPEFYIELMKRKRRSQELLDKFGENSEQYLEYSKEYTSWRKKNIIKGRPSSNWKDADFNKIKDDRVHQFLIELADDGDINLEGQQSNKLQILDNVVFYQVPNISSGGWEVLSTGQLLANAKDELNRLYDKNRADIEEYGSPLTQEGATDQKKLKDRKKALKEELRRRNALGGDVEMIQKELDLITVLTNSIGDIKNQVPIFYRGNNDLKTQSYDLISVYLQDFAMTENFAQKMQIKMAVETLAALVKDSTFTQTEGIQKKVLAHAMGDKTFEPVKEKAGVETNVWQAMEANMYTRLYGVKTINTMGAQVFNSLMGWAGTTMLGLNFLAGSANLLQGKISNFIEGVGGEFFNADNLKNAEVAYFGDMANWMNDVGKSNPLSKTNLFMDLLNIQGEFKSFTNKINEDSRFKALMKKSNLNFFNKMGEHYIHATLMYAILDGIKMKNKAGQYIDLKGKVVTKDKAMTFEQAFDVVDGNLKINPLVGKSSYGDQNISMNFDKDKGVAEVRLLVNKLAHDLHGNYNPEMQSKAQRHVVWKMILMLRKWMVPGFNRRFRGTAFITRPKDTLSESQRFYSEATQSFQEGQYATVLRFIYGTFQEAKYLGLTESFQKNKRNLTSGELANMRRSMTELGTMTLMFFASMLAYAGLDELDDDEESMALMYTAFYSRRLFTELNFYINPLSTFQILKSPAASISYAEDIVKLGQQFTNDTYNVLTGEPIERYERTRRKGMSKLWKRTTDVLPIFNQLDRPVEEAVSYLEMTSN